MSSLIDIAPAFPLLKLSKPVPQASEEQSVRNGLTYLMKSEDGYHLADEKVMVFHTGHLLALTWRAEKKTKPVIMLSTNSSANTITLPSHCESAETTRKPVVACLHVQPAYV